MWHACGTRMDLAVNLNGGGSRESGSDLGERSCGDEGTRTPNPCLAKAVLYQLSYAPRGGWFSDLV
jgi:hypothetical protein